MRDMAGHCGTWWDAGPRFPSIKREVLACRAAARIYERTVREEIEASRNFILQRAADFVLGKRGQVWLLCEHRANRADEGVIQS
jgi:hypothetical protein